MPAKGKNKSPAKLRDEAAAAAAKQAGAAPVNFASWETKVSRLRGRNHSDLIRGWLAHIPTINSPGGPPREAITAISAIDAALVRVPPTGELYESLGGDRSSVLHEALYLAHKAIHVQISCANAIRNGLHTWAVVDAYQASLFALGSVMAFLGLTVQRHENDFIVIDVWPDAGDVQKISKKIRGENDFYHFLRFRTLDHFHKWAMLKRLLRTMESESRLVVLLRDALAERDDKEFARHRNVVHYQSAGWIAGDLICPSEDGPIKRARSAQDLFDGIYAGTPSGTVYLMCVLIELCCEFAVGLQSSQVVSEEIVLLDRRIASRSMLTEFDWAKI
ncbi:hypothetical protein [Burkholderia gladioli]|uniref:hypothetical protein n=1 Tax=Burkholderia gladioli TaxID=28095 RepID=UPI00163F1B35|nr:hypothetical protein [Burkholderia gladioli]